MKQWKVTGKGGFDDLKLEENAAIPDVGDKEVLVKRKSPITSRSNTLN
jgi:hypothetical protein